MRSTCKWLGESSENVVFPPLHLHVKWPILPGSLCPLISRPDEVKNSINKTDIQCTLFSFIPPCSKRVRHLRFHLTESFIEWRSINIKWQSTECKSPSALSPKVVKIPQFLQNWTFFFLAYSKSSLICWLISWLNCNFTYFRIVSIPKNGASNHKLAMGIEFETFTGKTINCLLHIIQHIHTRTHSRWFPTWIRLSDGKDMKQTKCDFAVGIHNIFQ